MVMNEAVSPGHGMTSIPLKLQSVTCSPWLALCLTHVTHQLPLVCCCPPVHFSSSDLSPDPQAPTPSAFPPGRPSRPLTLNPTKRNSS